MFFTHVGKTKDKMEEMMDVEASGASCGFCSVTSFAMAGE